MRNPYQSAMNPVTVMVLATFHMSNPGHDMHNQSVDDMLSPRRQAEIAKVVDSLAAFKPSLVAVEWPAGVAAERYQKYQDGTLPASRNEVVQLGFRLAKRSGAPVFGIDADGDFPFDAVAEWAAAHGRKGELESVGAFFDKEVAEQSEALQRGGVTGELRLLNDPARIARDHSMGYRALLAYGEGEAQPGANLLAAWYKRNFVICAKLAQLVKPGQHAVVIYGAGHAALLRQCVQEMPGWKLAEPNSFLEK